jgi:SAM-dependent methyltransferase
VEPIIDFWRSEEAHPFVGWDFSYLDGRMIEEQPPWSYTTRACALMENATSLLDINTGGGERLLKMRPHWPAKVAATEEYPPNVKLATERLTPLGVRVVDARWNDSPLPFADGEFDLVINRHSAFAAGEVARILKPGGTFLTQQVHGLWAHDLIALFGASPQWPDATPATYLPQLEGAGLSIVNVEEWSGALTFLDVGAIVYYLKAVPWLVPGFSVETHLPVLLRLQAELDAQGRLSFDARKYIIEAQR